jgi:hypothetical protein
MCSFSFHIRHADQFDAFLGELVQDIGFVEDACPLQYIDSCRMENMMASLNGNWNSILATVGLVRCPKNFKSLSARNITSMIH